MTDYKTLKENETSIKAAGIRAKEHEQQHMALLGRSLATLTSRVANFSYYYLLEDERHTEDGEKHRVEELRSAAKPALTELYVVLEMLGVREEVENHAWKKIRQSYSKIKYGETHEG